MFEGKELLKRYYQELDYKEITQFTLSGFDPSKIEKYKQYYSTVEQESEYTQTEDEAQADFEFITKNFLNTPKPKPLKK